MLADDQRPGQPALLRRQLHRQHALGAAPLDRVFRDRRALAVAVLGDHEELGVVAGDVHGQHAVGLSADLARDVHPLDARGVAAHRSHRLLGEARGVAGLRDQQHVVVAGGQPHLHQLVAVADLDRDDPVRPDRRVVGGELGLLDQALRGREDQVLALAEVACRLHGHHPLLVAQRQHVHQGAALRGARALRQLVDLEPIHLAAVGEEEHPVVRRADVQVLDVVALLEVHPHHADAAAALLAVGRKRQALHVARAGDRDHHLLVGDHVLDVHVALEVGDLGAPLVAVTLLELVQLLHDDAVDPRRLSQDRPQGGDPLDQLGVLGANLVGLQRREPRQAHVEDRLGLLLGELELVDQPGTSGVGVGRGTDQLDHRVEVVERDQQPLEDVGARLGAAELELGPAGDHLALVVDVVVDQLLEAERAGHPVDQGDHVEAERGLHLGVLEELVEDDLVRVAAALQLDHQPHPRAVGLVAQVGDPVDLLLADQVGDLGDQPAVAALLDHERQLGDDHRLLAALQRLDVRRGRAPGRCRGRTRRRRGCPRRSSCRHPGSRAP